MIKKSNHLKPILVSDLSEINYCVIVLFFFFLFVVHGQTVGKHSLNCGNITNIKKPTIRNLTNLTIISSCPSSLVGNAVK
ncbi:hypothetical protein DERF_006524 [Dermatophagoides farinae]|uniref:Uncharacterized protein n=1 Tax=Dermatophagoides farinae TaxID=6954 RepID=A0A922L778_DERFA|nr:hypothetical protein DERF_006524 [Dermatophagoides farinae]